MTLISLLQKTRPRHVHISSLAAKTPVRMHDNFDHTSHQEFSHQKARMFWGTRGGPVRAMSSCIPSVRHTPLPSWKGLGPRLGLDEQSYAYSYAHAPKQSHYLARCHVYAASQRPNCLWPSDPRPSCSSTL
ncbi:hypothetical protein D6D21_01193 [Aureobasidium pullulans]|uniref:Uncharacterized protein n=1 Tax=Aureobasidium pullulans TaxID=5580 RepID=A0AB74JA85_AURPU|nr:hypothetical protein D6D21_01193 [Aureobasidium pullulans]